MNGKEQPLWDEVQDKVPDKAKGKDKDKFPNATAAKHTPEPGGVEDETVECKGSSFIVWDVEGQDKAHL